MYRVPLVLEKSIAVLYRLDLDNIKDSEPVAGESSGYDDLLREPLAYSDTVRGVPVRREARLEYPAVRVPCQVEPIRVEDLRQFAQGNAPNSDIILVFHRMDLERMRLINPETNEVLIKPNDRIAAIESFYRAGTASYPIKAPGVYVFQIRPASFGFGPKGHDLLIAYLSDRQRAR